MSIPVARRQQWFDSLAIGASTLCLIHCLALPILIVAVPTLATFLALPEAFHLWAFALAVPTSLLAMAAGRRRHGQRRPVLLAAVGLALLGAGALLVEGAAETVLTVAGGLTLAVAHALNWRAPMRCPG